MIQSKKGGSQWEDHRGRTTAGGSQREDHRHRTTCEEDASELQQLWQVIPSSGGKAGALITLMCSGLVELVFSGWQAVPMHVCMSGYAHTEAMWPLSPSILFS